MVLTPWDKEEESAKAFGSKGDEQMMRIFSEKALLLYRLLNEKDKTFSIERENTITDLENLLSTDV